MWSTGENLPSFPRLLPAVLRDWRDFCEERDETARGTSLAVPPFPKSPDHLRGRVFLCPLNPIGGGHLTDPDRAAALQAAVAFHAAVGDLPLKVGVDAAVTIAAGETAVRNSAEVFLAWLKGTVSITLHAGPITNQFSGVPIGTPTPQGGTVQLHDNEQFDLTVDTKDAKGFETPDTVSWVSADESVASLVVSPDGRTVTVVAGNPGSTVITATDDAAGLSATEAIDVVPAGTATISLVEGPVTVQP